MVIEIERPGTADHLKVLLITEGTYPFYHGGVSVFCDTLIRELPEVDFTLLSLVGNAGIRPVFDLTTNVTQFLPLPLWGTSEVLENRRDLTLGDLLGRKRRTTERETMRGFVPVFWAFLRAIFAEDDSQDIGWLIHRMYRFFQAHDFDATLRTQATWDCFTLAARQLFPPAARRAGYKDTEFDLCDVTDAMLLMYRWLMPLATALPPTDVVHAVSAGLCSLAAIAAKLEFGAGFLLSEHGIYLRERYLAEAESPSSLYLKMLSLGFVRRITQASYALADQISPGSNYNQRWEKFNGAPADRLLTIYNGVNPEQFPLLPEPAAQAHQVAWIGRITPIKDLVTFIRAAALALRQRPDLEFKVYGTAPAGDEGYYRSCLALRDQLGIGANFVFEGYAPTVQAALADAGVVILSSISEGFPFSVLEAMLCAKPVVATAVGGVPEALDGCGITVEPRNPDQMAEAILELVNDPARCATLGAAAREKAIQHFTLAQCATAYHQSYIRLMQHKAQRWPE